MSFPVMAAFPEEDEARGRLPGPVRNAPDRGEARDRLLLENVQEAAGLSRGREPSPAVWATAPEHIIQMPDGENAGGYRRCFICGVF